jgi:hypothetical protein
MRLGGIEFDVRREELGRHPRAMVTTQGGNVFSPGLVHPVLLCSSQQLIAAVLPVARVTDPWLDRAWREVTDIRCSMTPIHPLVVGLVAAKCARGHVYSRQAVQGIKALSQRRNGRGGRAASVTSLST